MTNIKTFSFSSSFLLFVCFFPSLSSPRKRSTDMQLMAQHKYGLRVKNEAVFVALIKQLGVAAVTVDFMEVRHSSPVSLNLSGCASTSKGESSSIDWFKQTIAFSKPLTKQIFSCLSIIIYCCIESYLLHAIQKQMFLFIQSIETVQWRKIYNFSYSSNTIQQAAIIFIFFAINDDASIPLIVAFVSYIS